MSRGPGALQRRLLGALWSRGESDCYDISALSDLFPRHFLDQCTVLHARWRWYTIDLLDLVTFGEPRSHRVSVHRAVRSLARAHRVQIADQCPYDDPFLAQVDYHGNQFGGLDLAEVSQYADPRWPGRQGRCLWFRLPPPMTDSLATDPRGDTARASTRGRTPSSRQTPRMHVPDDDQLIRLELLQEGFIPEAFDEFMGTIDRRRAWDSSTGRYLQWLLCGSPTVTAS